jgi:hypothetical protein
MRDDARVLIDRVQFPRPEPGNDPLLEFSKDFYSLEAFLTWVCIRTRMSRCPGIAQHECQAVLKKGRRQRGIRFRRDLFENQNLLAGTAASIAAARHLRDLGPDPRKTVMDTLRTPISINLAHEDDLAYVASLDELPADMQVNDFMALVRRESAKLKGLDYSHLTTYGIVGSVNFCFYPNLMGPITAGNWILHRFRPNGDDPNSCLYDLIFLHRFGDTEEVPAVTRERYPDWRAHEWGAVVEQDLANMAHVQSGMHELTYPGLRLNRQEAGIRNFHRFLDRYLL